MLRYRMQCFVFRRSGQNIEHNTSLANSGQFTDAILGTRKLSADVEEDNQINTKNPNSDNRYGDDPDISRLNVKSGRCRGNNTKPAMYIYFSLELGRYHIFFDI